MRDNSWLGLSLGDKSFGYFTYDVVNATDAAGAHLSLAVYQTSFLSDPDIFVSKVSSAARLSSPV